MSPAAALHHAARRYCLSRIERWSAAYADLVSRGLERDERRNGSWTYSIAARDTFPRYNVLYAILEEVEAFEPAKFGSLAGARSLLATAGDVAESALTESNDPTERAAMEHERRLFTEFVATTSARQLEDVLPLPYRRVLTRDAAGLRMAEVEQRWGRWYGGAVDRDRVDLPPHLILQASLLEEQGLVDDLRHVLSEHGVTRVFELREWGPSYELDLPFATFSYDGAEGWWLAAGAEWLVQASHEDSLTVGGDWMVEGLWARWPGWADLVYRGWDRRMPPVM